MTLARYLRHLLLGLLLIAATSSVLLFSDWSQRRSGDTKIPHIAVLQHASQAQLSDQVIARDKLTTLMVTHSMHQTVNLGDRLIMMHRGKIIYDFQGAEKRRLRVDNLLNRFEEVRRGDLLYETAAEMLQRTYV